MSREAAGGRHTHGTPSVNRGVGTRAVRDPFYGPVAYTDAGESPRVPRRHRAGARDDNLYLGPTPALSQRKREEIVAAMDAGADAAELARIYGVSKRTIYRYYARPTDPLRDIVRACLVDRVEDAEVLSYTIVAAIRRHGAAA